MSDCLKIVEELPQNTADEFLSRADEYLAAGTEPNAAHKAAARDLLAELASERKETFAAIKKAVEEHNDKLPKPMQSGMTTAALKPVPEVDPAAVNNPPAPPENQRGVVPGEEASRSVVKARREVAPEAPKEQAGPSGKASYRGAGPDVDLTTPEGRERARAEIRKIAGDVGIRFVDSLEGGAAGSYDPEGHVITLAVNHDGALGTAYHESLHAVFKAIAPLDKRELYKALNTIAVRQKLLKLLADSPEAMDAVRKDPEELAAYAFQFWKLGHLDLNPIASHWMEKFQQMLQRVWQWVRGQPSAEQIFDRVADGFYKDGADAAARAVAQLESTRSNIQKVFNAAARGYERLYDTVLTAMDDRLRLSGNSEITKIAQQLYTRVGELGDERGLAQSIPQRSKKFLNELGMLLGPDPTAADAALHALARGEDGGAIGQKVRGFLNRMYIYQREAGMDIGRVKDYLPMQWSGDKIEANKDEFISTLQNHKEDIAKLNKELRAKAGYPKDFHELTPNSIANMMAQRNRVESIPTGDVFDDNGVPTDHHAVDRVFSFLTNAERAPFVEDNLLGTMTQYVKQAVKRAEYVRRFGEQGEKLAKTLAEARRSGATDEQIKLVHSAIDNIYNVRYVKMDPALRRAMGAAQVYQNFRVLGLSLFSSVIDPLVLAVRTQEFGEAWGAYKAAVKSFLPKGRSELDELAEDIGAIEHEGVMDSIVDMYGGFEVEGMLGKANEALFTYNGMNGLTRGLRVYATGAGVRFITKHAQRGNTRMLRELGLNPADVHFMPDGSLAIRGTQFKELGMSNEEATTKARKVQDALNRFVDESVLRPNAQERPDWGSDPLWGLIFHLKQYLFSFNKVVGQKVRHELTETGNPRALLTAAPFIPIMGASAFVKDMIQFAGDPPVDRGFLHYLSQGWARSGFEGPAQLPLDMARDVLGGHSGIGTVAGPTVDQALGLMEAVGSGKGAQSVGDWVESALPLSTIYKRW